MNTQAILDIFTEKDGFRYSLAMPHRANGFLYASNGYIAVRVQDDPAIPCCENNGTPLFVDIPKNVEKWLSNTSDFDFQPIVLPEPVNETCPNCKGSGLFIKCVECDGTGEFEHGDYTYTCKSCDGKGRKKSDTGNLDCEECNGSGVREAFIPLRGMFFLPTSIRAIAVLPGIELAAIPGPFMQVKFRFNGGCGIIATVRV